MFEQNLSKLGFSPSEARVYMHLLKNGCNYTSRISSEIGINRTNIYEALDRLIAKGVVSFVIKNKVKWYEARSPDSILALIKEKETELHTTKKKLIDDIKVLNNSALPDKKSLEATIFTGKKGLRILFEEILETAKPISLIASELQFKGFFGHYFELWHKRRIEKNIRQRSIFPKAFRSKLKKRELLDYKFVDNVFTNPTTTIIYGNNCLFIQWSEKPIAVKIENKGITKSHLNYFNMVWNS